MQEREHDVIIWGATGFTGSLVAEYMVENAAQSLRWAIAGRNIQKLERLRDRLASIDSRMKDLPYIVTNINSTEALDLMVSSTKVILSTAGPFHKVGTPIVEACVRNGTDYVDSTGELPWVNEMISRFHKSASEKQVKIVHMCGLESLPSDLGALMMVEYIKNTLHKEPEGVRMVIQSMNGGGNWWNDWSSGSFTTAMYMFGNPLHLFHTMKGLLIEDNKKSPKERQSMIQRVKSIVKYDEEANSWTIPSLVTSPVTCATVNRTAELTEFYGPYFRYEERIAVPNLLIGWIGVVLMLVVFGILAFPLTGWILKKAMPHTSGSGPSRQTMKRGYMKADFFAQTHENPIPNASQTDVPSLAKIVKGSVQMRGHPGYTETAKMLSESAMALVIQRHHLPPNYGVTTPAAAIGIPLIDRLKKVGIDFSVSIPSTISG